MTDDLRTVTLALLVDTVAPDEIIRAAHDACRTRVWAWVTIADPGLPGHAAVETWRSERCTPERAAGQFYISSHAFKRFKITTSKDVSITDSADGLLIEIPCDAVVRNVEQRGSATLLDVRLLPDSSPG